MTPPPLPPPCLQLAVDPRLAIAGIIQMDPNFTSVGPYLSTYLTNYLLPSFFDNSDSKSYNYSLYLQV